MRYFATLVGKEKYGFNGLRFIKNAKQEVTEEVYNTLLDCELFEITTGPDRECMNIALAYSPNWAQYVRIEIFSIFKNNSAPVKIFLLSDSLGNIDTQSICDLFGPGYSCEFINMEDTFKRYVPSTVNVDTRFTKYTLYRLLLPKLVSVDKLLYIDTDALVCGNIRDLYDDAELDDNILAGVVDSGIGPFLQTINFTDKDTYINAGVVLMDMAKIKKLKLMDKWLEMVNSTFYHCHDQDILNITCRNKILKVSARYNASVSTKLDVSDIRIMHYAGRKPWSKLGKPKNEHLWRIVDQQYTEASLPKIPKIIHYCWFGKKSKPKIILECISSWKEHMPNYTLVEWNEYNFDVHCCPYVWDAYANKKYAFVTDYVRLWALHNFGGIYMDGDVEVIKPLDKFLTHRAFTGHETTGLLVTATMGAEPEHPWIEHLLSHYKNAKFSTTPNTQTITNMSRPHIVYEKDGFRHLSEGVIIYPVDVFCPYDHKKLKVLPTENTYAMHHFAGTWLGRTKI